MIELTALTLLAIFLIIFVARNEEKQKRDDDVELRPEDIFASFDHLDFKIANSSLEELDIIGKYREQPINFSIIRKGIGQPYILIELSNKQSEAQANTYVDILEAVSLLCPTRLPYTLKGHIYADKNRQQIYYEQVDAEIDVEYLQFVFDLLTDLLQAYSVLRKVGGKAVALVHESAKNTPSELHTIANQLLKDIGQDTAKQLAHQFRFTWCSRCLARYTAHQVNFLLGQPITYYGCRVCHQSQEFFEAKNGALAILDSQMRPERCLEDETLQVNWIKYRKVFDFDSVKIMRATDEEVERFAMQIGNDTDPVRRLRYKGMQCRVSSACNLSENTMRILRRTFGQVKVEEI